VTPRLRINIAVNRSRLLKFPSSRAVFLQPDGMVPELGTVLKQSELGKTFRLIAEQGPKVFYEGEIAQDIVKTVQSAPFQPGRLALEDLQRYRAVQREPIRFKYHGHDFVSMPPPSSGGITLGLMLGILEDSPIGKTKPGSVQEIELLARAGAASFADRNAYLGDQDWSPRVAMRTLLAPSYVKERAEAARATSAGAKYQPGKLPVTPAASSRTEGQDTTHFSIVDADRNVVACTTTIEHGMGSGLVVAGRGFLLNNELTDFDLDRETGPNALDAMQRQRTSALTDNQALGGKRPRSSMTPVIVFKDGQPILSAGSPGGAHIIGIVGQVLVNVLDHGMDIQQAINAPRVSSRNGPLGVEALYPAREELIKELRARGWKVQDSKALYDVWGGAHGIRIRPDGSLEGGADPRREGAVRGY
jgi:gamma-glutamyltranspeptidase/glutathione hydrolase